MREKLITVVMCTYNGERYLRKQLDSIITQTYKNIEVIIVDDCSTDNTYSILEEYASKYACVHIRQNKNNLGFNKNFEQALPLANGEFIAISDQDDIWYPEKLTKLYKRIGNKGLVFSNSELIDENDQLTGKRLLYNAIEVDSLSYQSILINNFVTGHTVLLKREFLKRALPFPADGYYDWWLGFIAFYYNEITYLDEVLTAYRFHSDSVVQKDLFTFRGKSSHEVLSQYNSTRIQLEQMKLHLKAKYNELFLNKVLLLYKERLTFFKKTQLFLFIYSNHNVLFPLRKRKRLISRSRFKYVSNYLKEITLAKQNLMKYNLL